MRNLRFVCAQPAILYYAWQVEVMLNNFRDMGVNLNNIDVVCKIENGVIPDWREPNVIRCAPVPMYNSFEDIYRFGEILNRLL